MEAPSARHACYCCLASAAIAGAVRCCCLGCCHFPATGCLLLLVQLQLLLRLLLLLSLLVDLLAGCPLLAAGC